ncbi:MAG: hypothetical protein JKX85_02875, partial [Phycisphaeraceae bacterium]|nr:hypothetical protein [Phycisphaeraceae bacterium]
MKTITLVLLLSLCTFAHAGVNNGGFERWEKDAPAKWAHTQQADAPASVLKLESKIVHKGKRSLYAEFYKDINPKNSGASYIIANGSFTSVSPKKSYNVSVDYYALD